MTGARVLVVDDDRATVLMLSRLLQKAGYHVISALEASQGVMQAHRERPALIVTDLMMPAGGGLSLLERLTLSAKTNTIPIIVLTASDDPEVGARARAAGATRVLRKPCDTERLLEAVEAALGGGG
jgi:CheY-like chemotaxis protein